MIKSSWVLSNPLIYSFHVCFFGITFLLFLFLPPLSLLFLPSPSLFLLRLLLFHHIIFLLFLPSPLSFLHLIFLKFPAVIPKITSQLVSNYSILAPCPASHPVVPVSPLQYSVERAIPRLSSPLPRYFSLLDVSLRRWGYVRVSGYFLPLTRDDQRWDGHVATLSQEQTGQALNWWVGLCVVRASVESFFISGSRRTNRHKADKKHKYRKPTPWRRDNVNIQTPTLRKGAPLY